MKYQSIKLPQAFAVFDRNKDGYVDAQELRFALCNYGETMTQQEADEVNIHNLSMFFISWSFRGARGRIYGHLVVEYR